MTSHRSPTTRTNTVTRYCHICREERETPSPLLDGMAAAPDAFVRALETHADSPRDGWSPREIIAHMADSEIVFGWRTRQILTEDDPAVASYDQEQSADAFFYRERDADLALETFRVTRAANLELLRRAEGVAWPRAYHQDGEHRTLGELVHHRADHDLQHLRQIGAAV